MAERGQPLLVYVDADSRLRRLVTATFRYDYTVETAASVAEVHCMVDPVALMINLSDDLDPETSWEQLTARWPSIPAVIILTTDAAIRSDCESYWALQPAAMVVNPDSADALERGVQLALSQRPAALQSDSVGSIATHRGGD